ncbi:NIPSNAP-domain-containing protein [Nadsonia fulvescens var. elongata DSM 6958]|uniref:NIPSNAP-domain-containing protein n=1 Tax=Nadsonia fulvescens var. elongata DSM 6958 TaxID=857566 RepID=A0A1E3PJW3_9ASCO|nr:NIPSNAP-domain-containing protein [Nadsonia fulvescens var. elongata DSM 6958]
MSNQLTAGFSCRSVLFSTWIKAYRPSLFTKIPYKYGLNSKSFSFSSSSLLYSSFKPSTFRFLSLAKNIFYGAPGLKELTDEVTVEDIDNTVYEVVTHHVKPGREAEYLKLIAPIYKQINFISTASSNLQLASNYRGTQLVGSWRQTTGDIDSYIHIWKYPSYYDYYHGNTVIKNCDHCKPLFSSKFSNLLRSRRLELVQAVGFPLWKTQANQDTATEKPLNNIFELRIYNLKPGKFYQWEHTWQQGLQCRQDVMKPFGAWFTQLGDLNKVYHLWQFESLEHRRAARQKCWDLPGWAESVEETIKVTDKMASNILVPLDFSPLK